MKKITRLATILILILSFAGCNNLTNAASLPKDSTSMNQETMLPLDEVKKIALTHAGVSEKDIEFDTIELHENADKSVEYSLEMESDIYKYTYRIHSSTGKILNSSAEEISRKTDVTSSSSSDAPKTVESSASATPDSVKSNPSPATAPATNISSSSSEGVTNITPEKAKEIALSHAGLKAADVTFIKVEKDQDNGALKYEVEFYHGNKEYDYDIAADTGKILSFDYDIESFSIPQNNTTASTSTDIGEAKAKAIAIAHAGLKAADVTFIKVEKDQDNGALKYEVEFYHGNKEYDYDIAADTGKILSFDYDIESFSIPQNNTTASTSTDIGEAKAKAIAIAHAGLKAADVTFIKVEKDQDNGALKYEVEFYHGNKEYDYDIAADTGKILSFDYDVESFSIPQNNTSAGASTDIGEAKAKAIALAKVPGANNNHIRIKRDYDDGCLVYEGEIIYDSMEYEFEIEAATGTITEWDSESVYD